jgi:hypothetical protein
MNFNRQTVVFILAMLSLFAEQWWLSEKRKKKKEYGTATY